MTMRHFIVKIKHCNECQGLYHFWLIGQNNNNNHHHLKKLDTKISKVYSLRKSWFPALSSNSFQMLLLSRLGGEGVVK